MYARSDWSKFIPNPEIFHGIRTSAYSAFYPAPLPALFTRATHKSFSRLNTIVNSELIDTKLDRHQRKVVIFHFLRLCKCQTVFLETVIKQNPEEENLPNFEVKI